MVNRTKFIYDGIIVNYMMKEQLHFGYHYDGARFINKDISKSDLFRAIQENKYGVDADIGQKNGYPEIEQKTVQRHLDKLVKAHVLTKVSKANLSKKRRRNNRTLYKLHSNTLFAYVLFLITLVTRGTLSESQAFLLLPRII
jgi:hypothetical protein